MLTSISTELGPCHVNKQNETYLNPHSWNNVSNMLFISQPLGVGMCLDGDYRVHILNGLYRILLCR